MKQVNCVSVFRISGIEEKKSKYTNQRGKVN